MAINFPDSPSTNDTHVVGDKKWIWNGTYWHLNQSTSNFSAQDGLPSNPVAGDFWFESDSGQLFVRYDSAWVEIGHATDFGSSMSDADGDTLIQLEEGSDEDIIRFDTAGTERMTIAANGAVNVGGTLTAGAFSGPLTGNVTGNASGTALTVTQAAQSAITSVGTLTALTVSGDLTVSGTTTTINSTTLTVDDKNIELGSVDSPSDTTADGGGITLKGASDKTILWTNSTDAWHFNQGINVTSGNVGIGTATPATALSVYTTASVGGITLDGSTYPAITLKGAGTIRGYIGIATAGGGFSSSSATGDIVVRSDSTKLHLGTGSGAAALTVSGTSVGIGTTSPTTYSSTSLHIAGSGTDASIKFTNTSTGAANTDGFDLESNGVDFNFVLREVGALKFWTSTAERMRITAAGLVGIGTTSPDDLLHVYKGSAGSVTTHADAQLTIEAPLTSGLQFLSGSGQENRIIFGDRYDNDIGGIVYDHDDNSMVFTTNSNNRMWIDSYGRVGIGKTAMSYGNLTVSDGNSGANAHSYTAMIVESDTYCALSILTPNNRVGYIMFADPQGTATSAISYDHNNNSFHISTNSVTRMTINSSGAMSKTSGTFDIPHPTKGGDWRLRHSFIEGPKADLIYRGTVTLSGGTATIDLDTESNMTDGTWEVLCQDPWAMVASSGNAVEWSLSGKTLTITSDTDDAVCSWMVIGERQDDHMVIDNDWADDEGHLITEYEGLDDHILPYEPGAEEEAG